MSDDLEKTKPRYESPTVLDLGELARGAGDCEAGTTVTVNCAIGTSPGPVCPAGGVVD